MSETLEMPKKHAPPSDLRMQLERMKEDVSAKLLQLSTIEAELEQRAKDLSYASEVVNAKAGNIIESEQFINFFSKPYAVIQTAKKNKVLVAVPKFVKGFQVGWLNRETDTFFIYELDQYSAWLGDVPSELLAEIDFKKKLEGTVIGDTLHFAPDQKENIKKKLGAHIKDITENQATILRGHEFDIIADMVENGSLPFKAAPVADSDRRAPTIGFSLRSYQKTAVDRFLETGAVGVFHPTGAGKSFIALYLMDIIKGKKLIIIPTKTLAEQWSYYIETFAPRLKDEVRISTYQGYREDGTEYALTVYDECQRLPADTFSRLAVIKTKYRVGLSASPHREDGRESYIFALTGYPVGLNWKDYMEKTGRSYHPIYVYVVASKAAKLRKLYSLVDSSKKTLIFCDTIELGKQIAAELKVPYIYGDTANRLEEVEKNRVLVVSRVMDLGVSIKDLQRIIEVDFLFGSRQQELQRTGRLMHSNEKDIRHDIIMTEEEISQYGKRLWALQEKGFTIKVRESA